MNARSATAEMGGKDPVSLAAAMAAGKKLAPDATMLLMIDHREVEGLFLAYGTAVDPTVKARCVARICLDLTVHAEIEEAVVYPLARKATGDKELVDHAIEEHAEMKALVAKLEGMSTVGRERDELMEKLRTSVEEHVAEEEGNLFPKLQAADVDLYEVGALVASKRLALFADRTGKKLPAESG